jgi:hypothetical protein
MLRIRQAQLDALRVQADREFARWAAPHLRAAHPGATAPQSDEDLLALAAAGMARARACGATDPNSLYEYLGLVVVHGLDFDERPEFRAHFASHSDANVAILTAALVMTHA